MTAWDLAREREFGATHTIVDVGSSDAHCEAHIKGAIWVSRGELPAYLTSAKPPGSLILTSEDGVSAAFTALDVNEIVEGDVRYLVGGNRAWASAGFELETGDDAIVGERIDHWHAASERPGDVTANVHAYLNWETDLLDLIETAAPAKGVVGEIQHVVGLEVGFVYFEQLERSVDLPGQSEPMNEVIDHADSAVSGGGGSFGRIIVSFGRRDDRAVPDFP